MNYSKSPIEKLGYQGWNQHQVFKSHLMMPTLYLKAIVKLFRDLSEVPIVLPELVTRLHNEIWRNMNDTERFEQYFKVRGVPAQYIRHSSDLTAGVKVTQAFSLIMMDIQKFMNKPGIYYFHSTFETESLKAASYLVKKALSNKIDAQMIDFGTYLKEVKTWDGRNETVEAIEKSQLLCLYFVGKEYATEFSVSVLQDILNSRLVKGKTTIICTHMEPAEFQKRYGFTPQATILKYEDGKVTSTVDDLLAYMRKG